MAQVCEVCGRGPQFGNRVSHAHNVTKRRWNLNCSRFTPSSTGNQENARLHLLHPFRESSEGRLTSERSGAL